MLVLPTHSRQKKKKRRRPAMNSFQYALFLVCTKRGGPSLRIEVRRSLKTANSCLGRPSSWTVEKVRYSAVGQGERCSYACFCNACPTVLSDLYRKEGTTKLNTRRPCITAQSVSATELVKAGVRSVYAQLRSNHNVAYRSG